MRQMNVAFCYWLFSQDTPYVDTELYLLVQPTTHAKKFPLVTVHITHDTWHMTTKSLHNTYFHNHWPTTTLGMQHTATTQYTSHIIQTFRITGLQQHSRHAAHSHNTVHQLHNTNFHNHWPTTTLGMQHTATTQYIALATHSYTALATHNYTGLASIAQTMSNNTLTW